MQGGGGKERDGGMRSAVDARRTARADETSRAAGCDGVHGEARHDGEGPRGGDITRLAADFVPDITARSLAGERERVDCGHCALDFGGALH